MLLHLLLCLSLGRGPLPAKTPVSSTSAHPYGAHPQHQGLSQILTLRAAVQQERKPVENDDTGAGTAGRPHLQTEDAGGRRKSDGHVPVLLWTSLWAGRGGGLLPSLVLACLRYESKCIHTLHQ